MARTTRCYVQAQRDDTQCIMKATLGGRDGTRGRHGASDGHPDQSALSSPRQPGDRAHLEKLSIMIQKLHRVQSLVELSQRPFLPTDGSGSISTLPEASNVASSEHDGEEPTPSSCDSQSAVTREQSSEPVILHRAQKTKYEQCESLVYFNDSLRAWLDNSDISRAPQKTVNAVSRPSCEYSSPLKSSGITATATAVAAAAHACPSPPVATSNTQASFEVDDVDLFYLPPPPHHVSTGDLWSEGTLEDTALTACSLATLTTSPQPAMTAKSSSPEPSPENAIGTALSTGRESCSEAAVPLESVRKCEDANIVPRDDEACSEERCSEASVPPSPREQLAQTQKLLENLQGSLRQKQKLLEDLARMRARKRALKITECVSQRQKLQKEVNEVEHLVAMLEDHERELIAQRSVCQARIRASAAMHASQSIRGLCAESSVLSDSPSSQIYTDEVNASCVGVWQGAKVLAKSLKQKSKRMHARYQSGRLPHDDDLSMHDGHELKHGSAEDSGVFLAAMECTQKLPSSRSLSVASQVARQIKSSAEDPSREASLELMSPSPSLRPPKATADVAAGRTLLHSRQENALEASGRLSRSARASIRKLGHLATKLKNVTDRAFRSSNFSGGYMGSEHSVHRGSITQGSVECRDEYEDSNVFRSKGLHPSATDDEPRKHSQGISSDDGSTLEAHQVCIELSNTQVGSMDDATVATVPPNPTPPPATDSRLSLFGAYAQSSLATDPSHADHADSQEMDASHMHAPHACPSSPALQSLLIPPPSLDAEGSVEGSGVDSARIAPCWSASELSGHIPAHSPEQNVPCPSSRPMHDSMQVARCSVTRARAPVPPLHAPHACSSEPQISHRSRHPMHASNASKSQDFRKGKFWSMAVRAVMRSDSGRNSSNTENKFASHDHARLHQVEASLSSVSNQLHEQREKLKRLQNELAGVISTLDTLVISQSVSQQLLEQARMSKVQSLCRKHGEPCSMHGKHACGTSEAVKASIEAGRLMEELMHDTDEELVRVKQMAWQQCMEFEWGVRPLVDTTIEAPQRMHGMHFVKWRAQASKLVRGIFRNKVKNDVPDSVQNISQNIPNNVPKVDVAAERCRDRQRSRMLRMAGMDRQQG